MKCCTCHAKSSSQNWRSDAPKCNTSQEISARILTSLMNMSLVLRLPRKMYLCRSSSNVSRLLPFWNATKSSRFADFWLSTKSLAPATQERHLNIKKCSEPVSSFTLLTSKCASRHNRLHFFDISTSKSGLSMVCLVHFDFDMCFAPQRHFFRHRNFQKWSEPFSFRGSSKSASCASLTWEWCVLYFWLPKVVRTPSVLYILTCKRASRHNGVHFFDMSTSKRSSMLVCFIFIHFDLETSFVPQRHALFRHVNFQNCSDTEVFCAFWLPTVLRATNGVQLFISHLTTWLCTHSLLFGPLEPQIIEKHSVSRLSYLFAHLDLLSSETFSFLILSSSLLFSSLLSSSLLLSDSSHLSFSPVEIVGSLTSKLPSLKLLGV